MKNNRACAWKLMPNTDKLRGELIAYRFFWPRKLCKYQLSMAKCRVISKGTTMIGLEYNWSGKKSCNNKKFHVMILAWSTGPTSITLNKISILLGRDIRSYVFIKSRIVFKKNVLGFWPLVPCKVIPLYQAAKKKKCCCT